MSEKNWTNSSKKCLLMVKQQQQQTSSFTCDVMFSHETCQVAEPRPHTHLLIANRTQTGCFACFLKHQTIYNTRTRTKMTTNTSHNGPWVRKLTC